MPSPFRPQSLCTGGTLCLESPFPGSLHIGLLPVQEVSLHFTWSVKITSSMEPNRQTRKVGRVLDTDSCQYKLNGKWCCCAGRALRGQQGLLPGKAELCKLPRWPPDKVHLNTYPAPPWPSKALPLNNQSAEALKGCQVFRAGKLLNRDYNEHMSFSTCPDA